MLLSSIAQEAVIALNLVPAANIGFDAVLDPDWTGETKILIQITDNVPEDRTQFGIFSWRSTLTISVVSDSSETAETIGKAAAAAVYKKFEQLEQTKHSGIWSIIKTGKSLQNIPGRTEFQCSSNFEVLHK
jgi:hypothetical protein